MPWGGDYVTSAELKAYVRIDDTVDDAQLALAVTAASRAVDEHCNRQFGKVSAPEARTYTAYWDRERGRYAVKIDDLMTEVGLTIAVDAGAITGYSLKPSNAAQKSEPWTLLLVDSDSAVTPTTDEDAVTVTATWGWTSVPTPVKQAVLLQGSRFFTRRQAPFGVAGSPELGSELRLLAKVDPDVAVTLTPFRRRRAVG